MRRIDVVLIGIGVFTIGGVIYLLFQQAGLDSQKAGIWTQAVLVGGLILWLLSYLLRVFTHNMTYHQQIRLYENAVIDKRLETMSPEELIQLQQEIEEENLNTPDP